MLGVLPLVGRGPSWGSLTGAEQPQGQPTELCLCSRWQFGLIAFQFPRLGSPLSCAAAKDSPVLPAGAQGVKPALPLLCHVL